MEKYDLVIIGGGPAGAGAGVYAARKLLKTALIAEEFGGQSVVSPSIENWIGTTKISGEELKKSFEEHVRAYAGEYVEIVLGDRVVTVISDNDGHYNVETKNGKTFHTKTILVATGGIRKKLLVPGAETLEHKGLTYCASCDGPLFSGMDVAVVGGGNAGFETASQLLAYAKSVTLLHRSPSYSADPSTVEHVLKHPNMTGLLNADPTEVLGEKFVSGLKYKDKVADEEKELAVAGVFVEIGMLPSTDFLKNVEINLDQIGRIVVDCKNQRSTCDGIWAAGDCTDGLYHQNNIAAGDAVKALEDIYLYLNAK